MTRKETNIVITAAKLVDAFKGFYPNMPYTFWLLQLIDDVEAWRKPDEIPNVP